VEAIKYTGADNLAEVLFFINNSNRKAKWTATEG